jgi:hypothetical protein
MTPIWGGSSLKDKLMTATLHADFMHARAWKVVASAVFMLSLSAGIAKADDAALARYRRSWNPFSGGPQLVSSADLHPQGQFFLRPYLYGEFSYGQFGDGFSARTQSLPQRLTALNPQVEMDYGITDSLEVDAYVSEVSWWEGAGGMQGAKSGNGVGDTTVFLKYRFLVQNPDSWVPSLTIASFVALPTSDWFGTPSVPGGFAPLGRLPATHFGAPELTEALFFRKNVRPFRFSGGLYYSYGVPTSRGGVAQHFGDILQYRLVMEHFLNDEHGLGYAVEIIGLHGLPFRVDGKPVDTGHGDFGLLGVQPTVEYRFSDHVVGAAGVLFTALGRNDIAAVYPNLSIYYYWSAKGKVVAR